LRILVVTADDHRTDWIERTLFDEGVDLTFVDGAEEGFARLSATGFALILVDPHLTDMRGPEFLRRLAERGIKTPVVIVSDQQGVEDMSRGFGFGVHAYVVVPQGDGSFCAASKHLVESIYRLTGQARTPPFIVTAQARSRWNSIEAG
jgi:DNA-binding response OmpR family regulator